MAEPCFKHRNQGLVYICWTGNQYSPEDFFPSLPPITKNENRQTKNCCNVFIMCQKLHHSLLHASVGECSLACIYYNEVETSHTASQKNPQRAAGICNNATSAQQEKGKKIMTLVLWHTASNRGEKLKKKKISNPSSISVDCTVALYI